MASIDSSSRPTRSSARRKGLGRPATMEAAPAAGSVRPSGPTSRSERVRAVLARVRAWMVVLPVDFALLALPAMLGHAAVRAHSRWRCWGCPADGGRYRARLHLSVLDELPSLLGRLLTAGAIVATVIALRHEQDAVTPSSSTR